MEDLERYKGMAESLAKYATSAAFKWQVTYSKEDSYVGPMMISEPLGLLVGSTALYFVTLAVTYMLRGYLGGLMALRGAHNLGLCLFSGAVWIYTTYLMVQDDHFASLESATCKRLTHPHFQLISFLFAASKVWEWFDTVLLIIKGNKLRFLHVLHHATTFWLYAIDHIFLSSIKYGVAVNAFIHTVMYAHYFRPFPKQFRPLITQLQIVQFIFSIAIHTAIYFHYDCEPLVHTHFYEYLTPYYIVVPFLFLFLNFYVQQYILAPSKPKTKSA
ncbi:Elongation of very long chain fatty acids protein 4 [Hondaea fermentalgiana]|uniref:Elongation of fatty acids protein n=1 Tax=Hondaea fermentalgiana TaxID=2315210 RepID=A0A2R5GP98_9STRA|nr:Elongation of very long chain fatty acids protein 4 [Hondaea fermentalgiana]|eukprot:GBG32706.1 Elongation of very long chain fatty acids protein 4 [Hondaea fermentalgiana]